MVQIQSEVEIFCDGVLVATGTIRSINMAGAWLTIREFPLDAASFLEIGIQLESGTKLRIPVRTLQYHGEELEVVIERLNPEIVSAIATLVGDN